MNKDKLSRRDFLLYSTVTLSGLALAACQPAPTEEVTEAAKPTEPPEEEAEEPTVETEEPVATEAPAEEPIELRQLWRIMGANEEASMNALFDKFEEMHPNITIDRVFAPYPEVEDKANAWIASDEPPALWSPIAVGGIRFFATRDRLVDLGPLMDRDGFDLTDFYEPTLTLCKWQDTMIGLPSMNGPTFMFYNKNLFDEAGLDYPTMDWDDESWNWDTFGEYAKALTKFDDDGRPTQYSLVSFGDSRYRLRHFGIEWFNKETLESGYPSKFAPEREGLVQILQMIHDMMWVDHVVPTPAESEAMEAMSPDLFLTGQIAMTIATPSSLESYAEISEFDWGMAAIPYPVDRPRWNYMYPDQWFIIKPQEHLEACWELLKFVTSTEGYNYYPVDALGWVPPRRSSADYYTDFVLNMESITHQYTSDDVALILAANETQETAWGHATVEYPTLWSEAIKPHLDLLNTNEIDAEEAVSRMEVDCTKLIDETTPDWARV
jgi:multiple sugar transport system substrate-binding protein